jgi:hypothetical protein
MRKRCAVGAEVVQSNAVDGDDGASVQTVICRSKDVQKLPCPGPEYGRLPTIWESRAGAIYRPPRTPSDSTEPHEAHCVPQ